ncbi:hypothetical protein R1T40_05495 [Tritonibacter scottomollicae]|uniref:Uncharacterized protein n=1 Tax=Tritonibacter scottomollicae TaxID=483013 RepID=A0ABZ0HJW2_TRISK|nr:hypothetical protein [Tritonibacter scottomollicae]WOI34186.1 hypothetical protein R1T40_05495 [Tritonibacter scottomollicae]
MNLNDILQELLPVALSGLSVLLTALIGSAAHTAKQRWGLDIEARHREALHSALMSGIRAGVERGPNEAAEVLIREAVEHAKRSVPDAILRLGPDDSVLSNLARSKLAGLIQRYID